METFERSWKITRASWAVLMRDKELALLPVFAFAAWLVVAASFLVPLALIVGDAASDESWTSNPGVWLLGFLFYVSSSYVMIFFNAAVVCGARERMSGGDPTMGSALRAASERAGVLLPWAIVSATVSMILRAIEQRSGLIGQIVVSLIGLAWSLVTFLVLPVLVVERIGPIAAVKRSGELFKRTWGENVVANAGIGLVSFFAIVAGAVVMTPLLMLGGPGVVVGLGAFVVWVGVVFAVSCALTSIFQMALYRFATEGTAPVFGDEYLRAAFQPKKPPFWKS